MSDNLFYMNKDNFEGNLLTRIHHSGIIKTQKHSISILVRLFGGKGDVLLATPTLKALKQKHPEARLVFQIIKETTHVVLGLPYIDEILSENDTVSHSNFDLFYSLWYGKKTHIIDAYAEAANVSLDSKKPEMIITSEHEKEADRFMDYYGLSHKDIIIAVNRGPTWPPRCWIDSRFQEVAEYFKKYYQARIVEISGAKNYGLGLDIDITGKSSIRQTAAVLKRCSLLLCVDSFPMHLGSVVEVPTIGLFGSTNPSYRLPFNNVSLGVVTKSECNNCYHWDSGAIWNACIHDRVYCMEGIGTYEAIKSMELMLKKTGKL